MFNPKNCIVNFELEQLSNKFFEKKVSGDNEFEEKMLAKFPKLEFIKVSNFLLSDYSEAITGEIIHVDGGVHAIGGSMLPE